MKTSTQEYKPDSPVDTFYKGLGGLTASLPAEDERCIKAQAILRHEASKRHFEKSLEKESGFDRLFRTRTSGRADWWPTITKRFEESNLSF